CFITHDRTLIRQVANKILEIDSGRPVIFPGDYDSYLYRKQLKNAENAGGLPSKQSPPKKHSRNGHSELLRGSEVQLRRDLKKEAGRLTRRIEEIHNQLERYGVRLAGLEALFSNPDQFESEDHLSASGEQYRLLKIEEQALWGEWERLSLESESVDRRLAGLEAH
ncbi:hypothetical protein M1N24_02405, partial [Dehalococcoidia bacterium]|nr:hypothetical protein [Dehalococcoidia bacterium]